MANEDQVEEVLTRHRERSAAYLYQHFREVLQTWPLFRDGDDIRVVAIDNGWSLAYCGAFGGRPFTPDMHTAVCPPNLLELNLVEDGKAGGGILYLLTIQLQPVKRGRGYGNSLYRAAIELGRRLQCTEVRQTPSGGWEGITRLDYLLRRDWLPDGNEVFYPLSYDDGKGEWQVFTKGYDYEKDFYQVLTADGEIVSQCWPNAGKMNATGKDTRSWEHTDNIKVRPDFDNWIGE